MKDTILTAVEYALFVFLVVSVVRFVWGALTHSDSFEHRALAAVSAFICLLAVCILYSGLFRRTGMSAVRHWTNDRATIDSARTFFRGQDVFFTRLANWLSPGPHVGYRPHPTLIPIIVIGVLYLIRCSIYLAVTRRRIKYAPRQELEDASVTGPVYWTHISAYAMVVSFLVVIVKWNAAAVVFSSLGIILLFVIGFMGPLQDFFVIVRDFALVVWRTLMSVGVSIAQGSLAIARAVRTFVERAQEFYVAHVSKPLRRMTGSAVDAAAKMERGRKQKLREEAGKHAKFGRPADARPADVPPEDVRPTAPPGS